MISVLLVDDDALVRSGLALILGGAPDIEVVDQVGDGQGGVTAARRHQPDVILMDVRMPLLDGIAATQRIIENARSQQSAAPAVIVLTTFGSDDYVVRAVAAGASGFLLKDTPPDEIVDAIRRVASGEPILSPSAMTALISQVVNHEPTRAHEAKTRLAPLTDRELDVAVAVGRGFSNAEIAASLHLSVATVKTHIGRLFTKLDVDNRVQVAICVHDAGLV